MRSLTSPFKMVVRKRQPSQRIKTVIEARNRRQQPSLAYFGKLEEKENVPFIAVVAVSRLSEKDADVSPHGVEERCLHFKGHTYELLPVKKHFIEKAL